MTDFEQVPEFTKDLNKSHKKFRTLYDDLEVFKMVLVSTLPDHLSGTVQISNLGQDVKVPIYKVKHFRCKALKGKGSRSGIRVIYAYEKNKDKVTLIEIYYKNIKKNHDKKKILKYFG